MDRKLYLVRTRRWDDNANMDQGGYVWNGVLYCGYDRDEARRIYHEHKSVEPAHAGWGGWDQAVAQSTTRGWTPKAQETLENYRVTVRGEIA